MLKTDSLLILCQINLLHEGWNLVLMKTSHSIQILILCGYSLLSKTIRVVLNGSLIALILPSFDSSHLPILTSKSAKQIFY